MQLSLPVTAVDDSVQPSGAANCVGRRPPSGARACGSGAPQSRLGIRGSANNGCQEARLLHLVAHPGWRKGGGREGLG